MKLKDLIIKGKGMSPSIRRSESQISIGGGGGAFLISLREALPFSGGGRRR